MRAGEWGHINQLDFIPVKNNILNYSLFLAEIFSTWESKQYKTSILKICYPSATLQWNKQQECMLMLQFDSKTSP